MVYLPHQVLGAEMLRFGFFGGAKIKIDGWKSYISTQQQVGAVFETMGANYGLNVMLNTETDTVQGKG